MKKDEVVQKLKEQINHGIVNENNYMGETTLEVEKNSLTSVLLFLKEAGYAVLMDLTAVDYLVPTIRTKIIYWLHNPSNFERVRIILFIVRHESIPSVTNLWEGADWYERELYDMFGVRFDGHPDLKRILMPDDWKGHPMCRDYALTEEPVEFKHGVKPKVPSQIIPYVESKPRRI
jgi:NADH-quinone oxidoreductase subunit C